MNDDELSELISEVLDEGSRDSLRRLEALALESSQFRRDVVQRLIDEALLVQEVRRAHVGDLFGDIKHAYDAKQSWKKWGAATAIAAFAIVAALLLMFTWFRGHDNTADAPAQLVDNPLRTLDVYPRDECAVLTSALAVEWTGDLQPQLGDTLGRSKLQLASGVVRLEFCSGATVIVEAPAEIRIESPDRAICSKGKVHVHAPSQAAGFVISVPGMDVVDLGTEFAVSVSDSGESEVHVIEGEVALEADAQALSKRLNKGQSAAFNELAGLRALQEETVGATFIDGERLAFLSLQSAEARYETWKNHNFAWHDDPATLVHFDFAASSTWSRVLTNLAPRIGEQAEGAVIGCDWQDGRWPGENAIEFKGVSDRVRLAIPGEYQSLSYLAWVSIDGFNRKRNALVLTDGWDIGEPHWQIGEEGELVLGISRRFNEDRGVFEGLDYKSPPILDRSDLGRWILLATVYDGERGEVIHYADGKRVATLAVENPSLLRFGAMELGNWRPEAQRVFLTRAFNGRMDELTILSRSLSDEEVAAAYEMGRTE